MTYSYFICACWFSSDPPPTKFRSTTQSPNQELKAHSFYDFIRSSLQFLLMCRTFPKELYSLILHSFLSNTCIKSIIKYAKIAVYSWNSSVSSADVADGVSFSTINVFVHARLILFPHVKLQITNQAHSKAVICLW